MANERFIGGDQLTAADEMRFYFHKSVMNNELIGGKGAYQISNAQKAESGPSFGPIQYDVGGNTDGRILLEKIAKQAVDGQGKRFIDDAELAQVKSHLYKSFKRFSDADQSVYNSLKPQLDQALNSEQGRTLIHQDYLMALDKKVAHLHEVIGSIKNPENKAALEQNPLAQMMIIDTENQFGVKVNQGLKAFLNRSETDGSVKVPYSGQNVSVNGQIGLEDIIRYKLETAYGQTDAGCRDLLRRTSNIINAVGVDNINLTAEDDAFLKTGLKDFLVQNGHSTKMLEAPALSGLKALANSQQNFQQIQNPTQPYNRSELNTSQAQTASIGGFGSNSSTDPELANLTNLNQTSTFAASDSRSGDAVNAALKMDADQPKIAAQPFTDPNHPANGLHASITEKFRAFSEGRGVPFAEPAERICAALTVAGMKEGMTAVDGIYPHKTSPEFMAKQAANPVDRMAIIDSQVATKTPVETSQEQAQQVMQAQEMQALARSQQQAQKHSGPSMG